MTEGLGMAADQLLGARPRIPAHVVHRAFPSETVMLDLETGLYHGLSAFHGQMLRALEASPTVGAALFALARDLPESGDRLDRELRELCVELSARGLLELLPPADG